MRDLHSGGFRRFLHMDILDKYDEVNSSYNWSILDELSDEDLYNEEKIVKKISVIQKNQERIDALRHIFPI